MGRSNIGNQPFVVAPVVGADVSPTAGIPAQAVQFGFKKVTNFGLAIAAVPVTREEIAWKCDGAGTVNGVHASVEVPGSSASISLDVKKNGSSILAAPLVLTNTSSAGLIYNATVSIPTFAAGDVITFSCTESSNTGMSGLAMWLNGVETSLPQ